VIKWQMAASEARVRSIDVGVVVDGIARLTRVDLFPSVGTNDFLRRSSKRTTARGGRVRIYSIKLL
jgi:hypothetical protein